MVAIDPTMAIGEGWAALPRADSLSVGVVGDGEGVLRRIRELLELDGLVVTVESLTPGELSGDRLGRVPDVLVVTGSAANPQRVWASVRRLRRRLPTVRTVVVAASVAGHDVRRMIEAGADGLVLERRMDTTLAVAVRAAMAGQVCVPRLSNQLVEAPALSYREKQILALAINGLSNAQIAGRLYLAESTVKSHLSSAFRRLGVRSRREAAAFVLGADESLRRSVLSAPQLTDAFLPPPRRVG
jgi:DNA-binding NarL/FixJ family response regulator